MDNMRSGAEFITSPKANHSNMNYIVKRLEACCDLHGGFCDDCPDIKVCVNAYDNRCSLGDTNCLMCGDEVPNTKICSNCGLPLSKPDLRKTLMKSIIFLIRGRTQCQ